MQGRMGMVTTYAKPRSYERTYAHVKAERHVLGNTFAGNLRQIACVEQQQIRVVCRCIENHRHQYALILCLSFWPCDKHRLAQISALPLPLPDIARQIEFNDSVKND